MRIAHFVQRYPPALGGSEAYFARLGRFLTAHGDGVRVFTSNAVDLSAFWSRHARTLPAGISMEDGVEVERFACWRWPARRYLLKLLSLFPSQLWRCLTMPASPTCFGMWRAARRFTEPLDIVHASAFPYGWPLACGLRLARRRGVPFVLTPFLHLGDPDDPNDRTRRWYTTSHLRWLLRQADLVFAQTPTERNAILGLDVVAERVILQGLGVDFDECTGGRREAARAAWQTRDAVAVGLLANQSVDKGSVDLLHAAETLWARGVRVQVVLGGPEMPAFLRFWETFAPRVPPERVVRLGVLDERQKKDFFAGIDLFALPSRSDSFGLVLLEAHANGVATVGYRAGGVADVIVDGENGLLARCGDVAALAEEIRRLAETPDLRRKMGEQGKIRAARDFRWGDKLNLVREQFAGLCSKMKGGRADIGK
ncbi:MAG: glycosyltransferase family 4 protein [Gemmataceae bacterium]